ncbi:glutathione S-transferase family protein [Kordiimonas aquimaris]|uniref:glutathione S-transferase family protein n=1 Tax=Kordiimonas aquimaris TaxID=707591 RepID=UPI0021D2DA5C|nr:glutathione S-transferase family protein [Kordiimonas aquimaris]
MKLYNSMSPNGMRVDIFIAEKGIEIETVNVGIMDGETQGEAFRKINSLGEVPVLELADGTIITESIAICRYLEAKHPAPALFGITEKEQALVEMWNRRIELKLFQVIGAIGLHTFELFRERITQVPEYAETQRNLFPERLGWLDKELSDDRAFIAGENFSVADITGMAMLGLCRFVQYEIPEELTRVKRWEAAIKARPSWPQMPG